MSKYNKPTQEQWNEIEKILINGGTKVGAAKEVLGSRTRESTIRNALARGDISTKISEAKEMVSKLEDDMRNMHEEFEKEADVVVGKKRNITVPETFKVPYTAKVFDIKKDVFKIETTLDVAEDATHLMIPDTQCKPDIDMSYLQWLGEYIVDKKPDVIIHIGDHADMPSLSSYDKGKGKAEGKRVQKDIEASIEGMNILLRPLRNLQDKELEMYGEIKYKPKMVMTLGNHEERIMRHVNDNPELQGFLSYDNLLYKEMGWEVHDFLKPVIINGVTYCHFMANPMTGRPYGGMAMNVLKNVGESFCMGHKQTLDVATRFLPSSGTQQWAIIAGAYYEHDEGYKGYQGNHHWRGIVIQHNVKDGSFNPMFVNLEYLKNKYS